jgi:hypothetical protein
MSVQIDPPIILRLETLEGCQIVMNGEPETITWQEIERRSQDSTIEDRARRGYAAIANIHRRFPTV